MNGIRERSCQFCYYEHFDANAYPCSMCVNGAMREDMYQPKGRRNKAENAVSPDVESGYFRPQNDCQWK